MNQVVQLTAAQPNLVRRYSPSGIVLVECDGSDGAFTVTMPDAKSARDVLFFVVKTDSGSNVIMVVFVDTQTSVLLANQHDCRGLLSNGTQYRLISSYLAITG